MMTENIPLQAPFRDVGFRPPTASVQRRPDGVLLLGSGHELPKPAACTTDWLAHWVRIRPDNPMLVQRGADDQWVKWSVQQVWDAIRSVASSLLSAGASAERPLAILSENSAEQALMMWGALYAGVPVAPVSPAYSALGGECTRLRAAVAVVNPHLIFVQDAEKYANALRALDMPPERVISVDAGWPGMQAFAAWAAAPHAPGLELHHAALQGEQPAKYMFTSGSTGVPKAVVQTRSMVAAAQEMAARVFKEDPVEQPVYLEWLPWHHVMGGNIVMNRILRFGATLYIDDGRPMPGRFDTTLKNLREVAPSLYFNVPIGLNMLIGELERDPAFAQHFFSRLKYVYYGGAVLSRDVYDRFQRLAVATTGERIVLTSVFGATESSGPAVTQYWAVDDVGCIGLPVSGVELKLLEDPNLPGRYEMRIRGPNIFREYLNAPELSANAFDEEGYYLLGDAVRFVNPQDPLAGLRFAGRFAEDFKLMNGTWVRTAALRTRLLEACSPLLKDAVLTSDGADTVGALAWPDAAACAKALPELAGLSAQALRGHPQLQAELQRRLSAMNAGVRAASMRIDRLGVLAEPASMQHYEVTDKGSINQRAVIERRADDVKALFLQPCHESVVQSGRD
ncbi:AMP-binding protein [Pseudoduganella sp. RAF53_2]|uniref:AMP-binding protein n=1 Tax=unclassified Pseudoduganella TaxID=2637179 RepID=UPI003F9B136D